MEQGNELIVVKQLPVIEENLKLLSEDIKKQVEQALSLVVSEDTVKDVKKVRTDLSKQFKGLEEQRKFVKESILKPYSDFEGVYKEYISDPFKNADVQLKEKIDNVEDNLKSEKETEVKTYFDELLVKEQIDFVDWEQTQIKVGLSDSLKSLKEKAKSFVDKVVAELELINTQQHPVDILVEYKKTLNVAHSITTVNNRIKEIEEAKARLEQQEKIKVQEQETIQKVEEVLLKPKEVEQEVIEPKMTVSFKVTHTKEKLKALKEFLVTGGYEYE